MLFIEEDAAGEPVLQGMGTASRQDSDALTAPIPRLDFYVNTERPLSTSGSTSQPQAASSGSGVDAGEDVIGASTALLLGPFEVQLGIWGGTNVMYPSLQASTTPTLAPLVRELNHDVTVEDFKRFDDYGLSMLTSHGGVSLGKVFILTGQEATSALKNQYKNDIAAKRLWVGQSVAVRRTGLLSILWPTKKAEGFIITPEFISRYNKGIPNSLVVMSICKGLANGTMANAFLAGGAGAFASFTDTVSTGFARDSAKYFIDRMIEGDTVQEALSKTRTAIGQVDDTTTPASFSFQGNGNLKLQGIGLRNGSFEQNLLHWVGNGGDIRILTRLSTVRPQDGNRFMVLSSGLGSISDSEAIVHQDFVVPSDASTLSFSYNVLSEEPHEFVGSSFDDQFEAHLYSGSEYSSSHLIAQESVNASSWSPILGVDQDGGLFPGGDDTAYQTGLKHSAINVQPFRGQSVRLRFRVFDRGDSIYDTAAVIDNARLQ